MYLNDTSNDRKTTTGERGYLDSQVPLVARSRGHTGEIVPGRSDSSESKCSMRLGDLLLAVKHPCVGHPHEDHGILQKSAIMLLYSAGTTIGDGAKTKTGSCVLQRMEYPFRYRGQGKEYVMFTCHFERA